MKINVTQEHIDNGRPLGHACPIALAMRDAGIERPYVSAERVGWGEVGQRKQRRLPFAAGRFVERFDRAWYFGSAKESLLPTPFSFDLDVTP